MDKEDYAPDINRWKYNEQEDRENQLYVMMKNELEPWQQNILILYLQNGLNAKKTAEAMGCTYHCLNPHLTEIKRIIKEKYADYD